MSKLYENAFKALNLLEEEDFELSAVETDELKDFLDNDEEEETVDIIDPNAETEEEVKDSYIGNVVLECSVCHSMIYKEPSEVVEDDESEEGLVNVGEECPYCMSTDGYKIVGQIAPYETTDVTVEVEPKDEEEDEVEVEDETEEVTESLKKRNVRKSLKESTKSKSRKDLDLEERNERVYIGEKREILMIQLKKFLLFLFVKLIISYKEKKV